MASFLRKNEQVFAWSMSDMVRINPELAVHKLYVDPTIRPVK